MLRTILIVDDNEMNRLVLSGILNRDYSVVEAEDGEKAMQILREMKYNFSAVLLDLVMPVMDGYQVLEQISKSPSLSQIPVIVTTASTDGDAEIKALSLGSTDYIPKPYNPEIILHRLRNIIAVRESSLLISALQKDKLTGLYNREPFFLAAEELILSKPAGYFILAAFDIEKFSLINDRYGNSHGDLILKHIADTINSTVTSAGGVCGRINGDNFALIYPVTLLQTNVLNEFHNLFVTDKAVPTVIFSTGRYLVDDLSLPVATMYGRAMMAKNSVKGRYDTHVAVYDNSMLDNALRVQRIIEEMENALKDGQFEAWFQPQYNNYTGELVGAEALARWRHPVKGLIPPGIFIPVFEKNGFIYELDKCVWEQTCAFLRKCIDSGLEICPISVNISRFDFQQKDMTSVLLGLLEKYGLDKNLLRLEVTESAFSADSVGIIKSVSELVEQGFTVEIDDFGSGYSSLNTLKDVPAQVLKLDMNFLTETGNSDRGGNIIASVMRMARWLDLTVIAEGVETEANVCYLKSIGCTYSQGYYFAKPMTSGHYFELLKVRSIGKQQSGLRKAEHLDTNDFWNPNSMATFIFNSFVGSACIFEYNNGKIELLRASEKYIKLFNRANIDIDTALKLDWASHIDGNNAEKVKNAMKKSIELNEDVSAVFVLNDIPNCPEKVYLQFKLRVIAHSDSRYLVYATYDNVSQWFDSERRWLKALTDFAVLNSEKDSAVCTVSVDENGGLSVMSAGESYYKLLGYTEEQFKTEAANPVETIHPDDKERVLKAIGYSDADFDGAYDLTCRLIKRSGAAVKVRMYGTSVYLYGMKTTATFAVICEIKNA